MATIISGIGQSKVITNLDTYTHTTLNSGPYFTSISVNEIPPSGITLTIKHNGTTVAGPTSAPAAPQEVLGLQTVIPCSIGDTIQVIVASSTLSDEGPNALKGILNIHQGVS